MCIRDRLRGLKDTRIPLLTNLLSYWPVGMGLAYIFGFVWEWGAISVWGGLIAGVSVAAVLHSMRFHLLSRGSRQLVSLPIHP